MMYITNLSGSCNPTIGVWPPPLLQPLFDSLSLMLLTNEKPEIALSSHECIYEYATLNIEREAEMSTHLTLWAV